jgi:hypothetical protein
MFSAEGKIAQKIWRRAYKTSVFLSFDLRGAVPRHIELHWVRALTVPIHLGLTDGPFVPHNPISTQKSPVPLPKFQMAPRLKILMSSGSKKGTQIYYHFLSKSPSKWIPSMFPKGAPIERDTRLQGNFTALLMYIFNISFGVPSKGALCSPADHATPPPMLRACYF